MLSHHAELLPPRTPHRRCRADFARTANPLFLTNPEWLVKATCVSAYGLSVGYIVLLLITLTNSWYRFKSLVLLFLGAKLYAVSVRQGGGRGKGGEEGERGREEKGSTTGRKGRKRGGQDKGAGGAGEEEEGERGREGEGKTRAMWGGEGEGSCTMKMQACLHHPACHFSSCPFRPANRPCPPSLAVLPFHGVHRLSPSPEPPGLRLRRGEAWLQYRFG